MKFIITFVFVFFAASTAVAGVLHNLGETEPVGCTTDWVEVEHGKICPKNDGDTLTMVTLEGGVINTATEIFEFDSAGMAALAKEKMLDALLELGCSSLGSHGGTLGFKCGKFKVGVKRIGSKLYVMYRSA